MRLPAGCLVLVLTLWGCDQQAAKKVGQEAAAPASSAETMLIETRSFDGGAAVRGGTVAAPKKEFGK